MKTEITDVSETQKKLTIEIPRYEGKAAEEALKAVKTMYVRLLADHFLGLK